MVDIANWNKSEAATLAEKEGKDHEGWSTGMPFHEHKLKF